MALPRNSSLVSMVSNFRNRSENEFEQFVQNEDIEISAPTTLKKVLCSL